MFRDSLFAFIHSNLNMFLSSIFVVERRVFGFEWEQERLESSANKINDSISEEDYLKAATLESALLAGIDLVATPAFLLTGQAIKKAVLTAAKDKISSKSIEELIKSGGKLDEGLLKNLDEAKKILKDHGIDEKLADDYLVANVNKAFPEAEIVGPKSVTSKILAETELAEKAIRANKAERELIIKTSGLDDATNLSTKQKDDIGPSII